MKKVDIIIRPHKLEEVRGALTAVGIRGVTVTDVKGFSRQGGTTGSSCGDEGGPTFNLKVRLEVLIPDAMLERIMQSAGEAARTGRLGDGKILVTDVLNVVRIRTGETGDAAI